MNSFKKIIFFMTALAAAAFYAAADNSKAAAAAFPVNNLEKNRGEQPDGKLKNQPSSEGAAKKLTSSKQSSKSNKQTVKKKLNKAVKNSKKSTVNNPVDKSLNKSVDKKKYDPQHYLFKLPYTPLQLGVYEYNFFKKPCNIIGVNFNFLAYSAYDSFIAGYSFSPVFRRRNTDFFGIESSLLTFSEVDENDCFYGLSTALLHIQFGRSPRHYGINMAVMNAGVNGIFAAGIFNFQTRSGIEFGWFNVHNELKDETPIQFGLINGCTHGVQFGILNYNEKSKVKVMPFFNYSPKPENDY